MSKKRPYYPIHKITTGKYTTGGEFYTDTGMPYIGPYHILPNGQYYTEFVPSNKSYELYDSISLNSENLVYNSLSKIKNNNYVAPIYFLPRPEPDQYKLGYFIRYFVQKKSDPKTTIMEIDRDQYISVNTTNGPGINGVLWRRAELDWRINGDISFVSQINSNTINQKEIEFPGIAKYITNLIQFIL